MSNEKFRCLGLAGLVWGLLLLAGCAKAEAPAIEASAPQGPPPTTEPAAEAAAQTGGALEVAATPRKVIRRGELTVSSDAVRTVADSAVAVVSRVNGYVATREERHAGGELVASTLELRVPEVTFDAVVGELQGLGQVLGHKSTAEDVTEQWTDVEARIRAQRTLEERLLTLSTSQQAVKELLEVERELARVRSLIEQLEGKRQWLGSQTAFSTIVLLVVSPDQPVAAGTEGVLSQLENAVADGLSASLYVITSMIRVALAFLPFLPIPILIYIAYRWRRRVAVRVASGAQA